MKIELNIEKKHFWMLLSAIIILSMIILVYAYGTNAPSTFGHSAGEVDVDIGGQAKTLQQAITDGDFVSVDTDTKCDTAGNCAQVCVGNDCKSAWPTNDYNITCTWTGERAVTGNSGGCIDDIFVTCTNGVVTNMRFSC